MSQLIELHDITKKYQVGGTEQIILKGINLELRAGELVAIMGASGSGKSTLLNILGMLDRPTSGQYLLEGREIGALPEEERAIARNQYIGFVFQAFFLLPRLSIVQNVGLPLVYRNWEESAIAPRALAMLEKVGLSDRARHKPNQLSGGQQQRAAIARALVGNPKVILADEPTGALDTQTGQVIMDLFIDLNQKEHVTTIIVTHDPKVAAQCQRTIHIQDGGIVG